MKARQDRNVGKMKSLFLLADHPDVVGAGRPGAVRGHPHARAGTLGQTPPDILGGQSLTEANTRLFKIGMDRNNCLLRQPAQPVNPAQPVFFL